MSIWEELASPAQRAELPGGLPNPLRLLAFVAKHAPQAATAG